MDEKLKKRVEELVSEKISVVPYDSGWIQMFNDEACFLKKIWAGRKEVN